MKNKRNSIRLVVTFALAFCFLPLNAQQHQSKYYLSTWGALGYANLLHKVPETSAYGGFGGLLGAGFEYNYKKFILTFGVEFDYKNTYTGLKDYSFDVGKKEIGADGKPIIVGGVIDTEGDICVMHFDFDNYKDNYRTTYFNFPLLLGGEFNTFYFLAGGKVGLFFGREARVSTAYTTTGSYKELIDDFRDMPEHFYGPQKSGERNDLEFGINAIASLELGKTFYPKNSKFHFRVGAFADYGILNINKNVSHGAPVRVPKEGNVVELQHTSILSSDMAVGQSINPLLVGVKFTLLFDLGNKEDCNCIPVYNSKWKKQKTSRTSYIKTPKASAKRYKK